MSDYLKIARDVLRERQSAEGGDGSTLEAALRGKAIELWSDVLGGRLWLVADDGDARQLAQPRGSVYTAAEARMIIQISEPPIVSEVNAWKRRFDGTLRQLDREA